MSIYLHIFRKNLQIVMVLYESRHCGTRALAVGNLPSAELRYPRRLKMYEHAEHENHTVCTHTILCISLVHHNWIQLTMKPQQEKADVSCILNNSLNEGLLILEVLLQRENLVHATPPLIIIGDWRHHILNQVDILYFDRVVLAHCICQCNAVLCIFVQLRFCARSTLAN